VFAARTALLVLTTLVSTVHTRERKHQHLKDADVSVLGDPLGRHHARGSGDISRLTPVKR
jgi:hypothetical protein